MADFTGLPEGLPAPVNDGGADHLVGLRMPSVELASTAGGMVDPGALPGLVVIYAYPMTGRPGIALPEGWDAIPGARGCTPQSCAFRDHFDELRGLGVAAVFGLSTQTTDYQREAAERLHLPFPLLSDRKLSLRDVLRLPVMQVEGETLLRRLTMVVEDGTIRKVFYPVFPPDGNAAEVIGYLKTR